MRERERERKGITTAALWHTQYYFNKLSIPTSGGNVTCVTYKPDIHVCGFDNSGTPMNLYSTYQLNIPASDEGLGLQNTTGHEIVSSTVIQLSGLQFLDSVIALAAAKYVTTGVCKDAAEALKKLILEVYI